MNFSDKIKKLNVLEKLLNEELVNIKKTLGDEEIVNQVNEEVKQFLLASMESIFNGVATPSNALSIQETIVLKELAGKIITKATGAPPATRPDPLPLSSGAVAYAHGEHIPPAPPPAPPSAPVSRRKGSPVLEALAAHGFNPNASLEERKAAVKSIAQSSSKK